MKTAKDIMTKNPIIIQSGSEITEQLKLFLDNDISSAPVLSPLGEILGSLNEVSLIKSYLMHRLNNKEGNNKVIHHKDLLEPTLMIKDSEPITSVIKIMIQAPNHRVVVINSSQRIVGVISPKDVLKFLAGDDKQNVLLKDELEETQKKLKNLKNQFESLQSLLNNYKDIYQDAPAMMHSVNAEGKIIMANKKIHQALGYDEGELLGKTIFELYAKNCHGSAAYGLRKIMDDGFHTSTYSTMVKKDGSKIRVDVASSALRDGHGKFIGTISASRPIDSDSLLRALHGVFEKEKIEKDDLEYLLSMDAKDKK